MNNGIYGEQDMLMAISSVDIDTFLLRALTDSLAKLAPRGPLGKRSAYAPCIFSLIKLITGVSL